MRSPRRTFRLAALAVGAVLALAGCDDDGAVGDEDLATAAVDDDGGGDGGEEQPADPVEPPAEPMELELEPGDRSASSDGGTVTVDGDRVAFVLPTGNISCVMTTESATCQIDDKTYTPSADQLVPDLVGPCNVAEVNAMRTVAESAAWTCVSEDLTTDARPSASGWWVHEVDGETAEVDDEEVAVLPYGQRIQLGPVWCESSESGVTCANPELDGRRFELSRGSFAYDRGA